MDQADRDADGAGDACDPYQLRGGGETGCHSAGLSTKKARASRRDHGHGAARSLGGGRFSVDGLLKKE